MRSSTPHEQHQHQQQQKNQARQRTGRTLRLSERGLLPSMRSARSAEANTASGSRLSTGGLPPPRPSSSSTMKLSASPRLRGGRAAQDKDDEHDEESRTVQRKCDDATHAAGSANQPRDGTTIKLAVNAYVNHYTAWR